MASIRPVVIAVRVWLHTARTFLDVWLRTSRLNACVWLHTARLGFLWQCSGHSLTYTWVRLVLEVFVFKGTTLRKRSPKSILGRLLHNWCSTRPSTTSPSRCPRASDNALVGCSGWPCPQDSSPLMTAMYPNHQGAMPSHESPGEGEILTAMQGNLVLVPAQVSHDAMVGGANTTWV